jgi:hypothetical protein
MTTKHDQAMLAAFEVIYPKPRSDADIAYHQARMRVFAAGWNARGASMLQLLPATIDRAIEAARPALARATDPEAVAEIEAKMKACRDAIAERERERLVQVGALADDGVVAQREDGE